MVCEEGVAAMVKSGGGGLTSTVRCTWGAAE
jgi:hypothetical protein